MEAFAAGLLTIATATWVGAIVFQSAIVAPAVVVELDAPGARRVLRTLFPRFYRLGIICGVVMGIGIVMLFSAGGHAPSLVAVAAAACVMLLLELVSLGLVPRINAARDAGEAAHGRFQRLHRASVALTVVILVLGLVTLSFIGMNAASGLAS